MGDFLAGVFAPVAFVWFIAAVFYQRQELKNSFEEFRQQTDALKGQADTASKALRFELNESRKRAYRDWRKDQPTFVYDGGSHGLTDKLIHARIKVVNAPMFEVIIEGNDDEFVKPSSYVPEGGEFILTHPNNRDDIDTVHAWGIVYKDRNGDLSVVRLTLSGRDGLKGSYQQVEPEEVPDDIT